MLRHTLVLASCLAVGGCGEDERLEVGETTNIDDDDDDERDDGQFDFEDSQALDALRDPRTRQGLCNLLGLLASAQAGAQVVCQGVVDACLQLPAPAADGSAPLPLVTDDLSGLLECPATVTAIDACIAGLLSVAREGYADASCSQEQMAAVPQNALLGTIACAPLLIACPDLVAPLLQAVQGANAP